MTDRTIRSIFSDRTDNFRTRVVGIYRVLASGNVAAGIWAEVTFRDSPIRDSVDALGLVGDKLLLRGPFWNAMPVINNNPGAGCAIVALLIVTWPISFVLHRAKGYDRLLCVPNPPLELRWGSHDPW